jgi:hypothetical protein
MVNPALGLRRLRHSFAELEKRFLLPHLTDMQLVAPGIGETLDVNAFAVMAHGALEGFCENVALWVLHKACDAWCLRKRMTPSLACLLLVAGDPSMECNSQEGAYDRIRRSLNDIRQTVSRSVNENTGVDIAHLRKLFYPLGVDIPEVPPCMSALAKLVTLRHEVAHRNRHAASVRRTAMEVKEYGERCLELAKAIFAKVQILRF